MILRGQLFGLHDGAADRALVLGCRRQAWLLLRWRPLVASRGQSNGHARTDQYHQGRNDNYCRQFHGTSPLLQIGGLSIIPLRLRTPPESPMAGYVNPAEEKLRGLREEREPHLARP